MSGTDGSHPRSEGQDRAEAEARVRAAYAALPALLMRHEATEDAVLRARLDLGAACADAGRLEDAVQQVDELVKDCLRTHGEEHPLSREARALEASVWERARAEHEGRAGGRASHPPQDMPGS